MNIIISNASPEPIYRQILLQLKHMVLTGELKAGEPLPSIRMLAKELQISVITTKRAYEELEKEGFIETVSGKGSFVSQQNSELVREGRLRTVEEKLAEAVQAAQFAGLSLGEIIEMLELIYEEAEK